jgi:predicted Zn-dependent protease
MLILLVALFYPLGCTVNPVTLKQEFNIISEEKEIRLGRNASYQVVQSFGGLYDDPYLQQYVDGVGQGLVKVCDRPHIQYYFFVIDSPIMNAFALPGGYIYITRGLLAEIENEAQLAGVLGHEIGHVCARHSAISISEAVGYQMATLAAMATPNAGEMITVASALSQTMMLGYSREREFESDTMGLSYMYRAGYDPTQMAAFLYLLSRSGQGPAGYGIYSSTHPDIFERVQITRSKAKLMVALDLTQNKLRESNGVGEIVVTREEVVGYEGKVLENEYRLHLEGLLYGSRQNPRRIHIYTVKQGDTVFSVAEEVLGDAHVAEEIAELNHVDVNELLPPGTKLKVFY